MTGWVARNDALVQWVRPTAGALCCVRMRPAVFDDAAVERCYANMTARGVRVGRGAWFGDEDRVFRLGFGLADAQELIAALEELSLAMAEASQT